MNNTEAVFEWKLDSGIGPEVWLYVNPLTGKYAKVRDDGEPLAVFKNENIGRAYEQKSEILKTMIGHYVEFSEMLKIANEKYDGKYELINFVE